MLRSAVLTLAVLALAPAAAGAATLTLDGASTIHYTAGDGEANRVSMKVIDVGYGMVKDDGVQGLTGCGTVWSEPGWLACPNARRPQISLGDQDDTTWITDGGSEPGDWIGAARIDGGAGNDELRATAGADDLLIGGPGNDTLHAEFGANRLEGGEGDDTLRSGFSDDTKIGGPGADTFQGHDGNETVEAVDGAGTDTITCGDGTDTVTADWNDTVAADCETVTRVGSPPKDERPGEDKPGDEQPGGDGPGNATPGNDIPSGPVEPSGPVVPQADRTAPKLTVKVERKRGRRILVVRADEAVTLRGADRVRTLEAGRAARIAVGRKRLKLVARDAAGNETVRRIRVR